MQWELYIQIVDCEFCIDSSAAGASKFGHADRWNYQFITALSRLSGAEVYVYDGGVAYCTC